MRETSEVSAAASGIPVSTTAWEKQSEGGIPSLIYCLLCRIFLSAAASSVNDSLLLFSKNDG